MKYSRYIELCLTLLILNSTFGTNLTLKTPQNDKKLSNYVCKITKDIIKWKDDTQDVFLGNFGSPAWTPTINDIAGCIADDNPVVITGYKSVPVSKVLRKAAVVILTVDDIDQKILNVTLRPNFKSNVQHFMAKMLIIVPNTISDAETDEALEAFSKFGVLNIAFVRETANGDIQVRINASLVSQQSSVMVSPNTSLIFPDKLNNMQGFTYIVPLYRQHPRIYIVNGTVITPMVHFINIIKEIQNATVQYIIEPYVGNITDRWLKRTMHLSLNSAFHMKSIYREPELLTYEETGYCALVPLPPKVSLFQSNIIKPFDGLTWLFLGLTMVCCVAVWWMFRGLGAVDSPWLLAYGMFVMFIGQGVVFSRQNRLVLTMLLQLIIGMIWVLSQAYEGVMTSFMIQPNERQIFRTFDELVASDYEIIADEAFALGISKSEAYKVLGSRLNISGPYIGSRFPYELTRDQYVFILTCEQSEVIVQVTLPQVKRKVSEFYYLLPQKILPYLLYLPASYLNPFVDRLQYYMDLCFQAGLMHIWMVFTSEYHPYRENDSISKESSNIKFEDLTQVFTILMIGYGLSTAAFLIEVFFHDILGRLRLSYVARNLTNRIHQLAFKKKKQSKHPKYQKGALYYIIHRRKRVKRLKARKLKVRRIYVQPRFPMD